MSMLNFNEIEVLEIHTPIGEHFSPQWSATYYIYGISYFYSNFDIKSGLCVKLLNS